MKKVFVATYFDLSGETREVQIDAESREQAWEIFEQMNICYDENECVFMSEEYVRNRYN